MSVFDFEEEIARERASALSDRDRAAVRTTISRQRIPEAVRAAGWKYLLRGDTVDFDKESVVVVVGISPRNASELQALGALQVCGVGGADIWVFDIDDYESADDLARVLPGVKAPAQTPVVAQYLNGALVGATEGKEALDVLANLHL